VVTPTISLFKKWRHVKGDDMEESESKVYYIVDSGDESGGYGYDSYVKIGYTVGEVKERLNALQTGNPRLLTLLYTEIGGIELEREIHALCFKYRAKGEWFLYNKELVDLLWVGIKKRAFERLDKLKEQTWVYEMEEIKAIKEKYEVMRNNIQVESSGNMSYLIIRPCPKKGKK